METPESTAARDEEDEEIPDTFEEEEELPTESPDAVLERCSQSTGITPFDMLKQDVLGWLTGEIDAAVVMQRWLEWDQDLGQRHHFFQEGLRFQEWSEPVLEAGRSVFEQFEWIQEQMQRLAQAIEESAQLEAAYAVEQMFLSVLELQRAYAQLEAVPQPPPMSDSPLLAELIRVGQLTAEQKLPVEAFLERLTVYCDLHQQMRSALAAMVPTPRERAVLQEQDEALQAAFAQHDRGVEELFQFSEDGDRHRLDRGFEALEQSSQSLRMIRGLLSGAIAVEEELSCPYCGHSNSRSERFCKSCEARLRAFADESIGSDASQLNDGAMGLPSNLLRLSTAVQKAQVGEISPAELAGVVRWFRGLQEQARRSLENMKPLPEATPVEGLQLMEQATETASTGLDRIEDGLAILESWASGQGAGVDALVTGWETVLAGADTLRELEHCYQQAQQLAEPGSAGLTDEH